MPAFPRPTFAYTLDLAAERKHLRAHKAKRSLPEKDDDHLLLATWNIANLGLQKRGDAHHRLLAEMVGWFDLVAIQEVNLDLGGLRGVQAHLPAHYACVFSDAGGNKERSCFVYDASKLALLDFVGEVGGPPSDYGHIKLPGVKSPFNGFDRNPYIASFGWRDRTFSLLTVHSFFGKENSRPDLERRTLETYAIARWADLERKSKHAFSSDILVMGDFNLPKTEPGDAVYDALVKRGLQLPAHQQGVQQHHRR